MIIYLAGAQTGGNIPTAERRNILMMPSSGGGFSNLTDEDISGKPSHSDKILLEGRECDCSWLGSPRGGAGGGYDPIIRKHKPYILESFYYVDADTERLLPHFGDFLLDSGAFTFMQGKSGNNTDFEKYVEDYACILFADKKAVITCHRGAKASTQNG